jgi:hypothetical protein
MREVKLIDLVLVKVALRRSFQESAILSEPFTSIFRNLPTPEGQFSKLGGVKPSFEAKAMADFRIPKLMKFS